MLTSIGTRKRTKTNAVITNETVTKTGYIHVEADSVEDAEARLQESFGHYYVITETGEELSMGWEPTGEVEEDPE